jgi:thiol-disulfide isomerase/thioredoxin
VPHDREIERFRFHRIRTPLSGTEKIVIRRASLLLAALCVSFNALAQDVDMSQPNPFASSNPSESKISAFDRDVTWLNSRPLGAAELRGKVVLVDFWTYTCINWRRTLPWLRTWAEQYRDSGLVVIGVHTPEFGFEADVDNIRQAVRAQDVGYPVAVDSGHSIWDDFGNQFWPAVYLLDARGRVRERKFGEGGYEQLENAIQRLLAESGRRTFDTRPVAVRVYGAELGADWRNMRSPETYVGTAHGESFASVRTVFADRSRVYGYPSHLRLNEWALAGSWTLNPDSAVLRAARGKVVFKFHARDLHIVMGPATHGTSIPYRVTIDGRPPGAAHGIDTDAEGRGTVDAQRMYQLIRQPQPIGDRQFEIEFLEPGVEIFVFTFG